MAICNHMGCRFAVRIVADEDRGPGRLSCSPEEVDALVGQLKQNLGHGWVKEILNIYIYYATVGNPTEMEINHFKALSWWLQRKLGD